MTFGSAFIRIRSESMLRHGDRARLPSLWWHHDKLDPPMDPRQKSSLAHRGRVGDGKMPSPCLHAMPSFRSGAIMSPALCIPAELPRATTTDGHSPPPPWPCSRAQPADLIDADGCPDRPSSFYMPSTIDTTSDHACHCQRCGTCTSRTVPAGWPQACTLHSRPVTSRAGGMRVTALRPLAAHPIQCMRVVCLSSVR